VPRPSILVAGTIAVSISSVLNALGVFTEEAIHWFNLFIGLAAYTAAALVVFGWFVRRACRPEARAWPTALVFALLALLTVPAFWSGLPPIFGVAAIYVGSVAREKDAVSAKRAGLIAIVIGLLAIALDIAAFATDIARRV
jgi:hypothetical protein